jgi:hypothetical protein
LTLGKYSPEIWSQARENIIKEVKILAGHPKGQISVQITK